MRRSEHTSLRPLRAAPIHTVSGASCGGRAVCIRAPPHVQRSAVRVHCVLFSTHGGGVRTCFNSARLPPQATVVRAEPTSFREATRFVLLRGRYPLRRIY